MAGSMSDYLTFGVGQLSPFSPKILKWDDIAPYPVISNVCGGAVKISSLMFTGTDTATPAVGYFKVYEKKSPDFLEDDPDIVIPFVAGSQWNFGGLAPGVLIREGDSGGVTEGAYFDTVSIYVSLNPGSDEADNPVTMGEVPCGISFLDADLTSVQL